METREYQKRVNDLTAKGCEITKLTDGNILLADLLHHTLGICSEAGEFATSVKAHYAYNTPLDKENLIEELGDLMFYIAGVCNNLAVQLEEVMNRNMEKLARRYPKGFNKSDAIKRKDKNGES